MTAAVPMPYVQGTPEWEVARLDGIGSSDIPVIAGESPYTSPLELWAVKTRRIEPQVDDTQRELFEIGHLMEPVLLELYERRTGRHPKRVSRMLRHPYVPWARASLDGQAPVRRVIEAKWSTSSRWGDAGVPDDVLMQCQWQLFVTGWDVVDVVALATRAARVVEVPRDQGYIDDLYSLAADFWQHVQDGVQPAADGSESTRRALARLHPADDGTLIPATPELADLVAELRAAKQAAKDADDWEATTANALRALIAGASGIEGLVTYRKNADSTRVNWPAVAQAYRERIDQLVPLLVSAHVPGEIVADLDAIQSSHTTPVDGPRVLRLAKEKTA